MNIVLHEPEILINTGNIGRTCVAAGANLHMIRPLGFHVDDKAIKKAGMDYWSSLHVRYYDDFNDFLRSVKPSQLYLATTKATRRYTDVRFTQNSFIMFGKESAGLPPYIREQYPDSCVRIPMCDASRSINLSNAVSIVLYEALRQNHFINLR